MGREKITIGNIGESKAQEFLRRRGYKILALNYRTFFGEIDAVTRKDGFVVFIEVKTRTSSSLGPPFLSVTRTKQIHLIRNALYYLKKKGLLVSNWRIDIASVRLDDEYNLIDIEIIENAVEDII